MNMEHISDIDWKQRSHIVREILNGDDSNKLNRGGWKEIISEQLLRGDSFPEARSQAWTHIIIELIYCLPHIENDAIKKIMLKIHLVEEKTKSICGIDNILKTFNECTQNREILRGIANDKPTLRHRGDSHIRLFSKLDVGNDQILNSGADDEAERFAEEASIKMSSDAKSCEKSCSSGKNSIRTSGKESKEISSTSSKKEKPAIRSGRKHRTSKKIEATKKAKKTKKSSPKSSPRNVTTGDEVIDKPTTQPKNHDSITEKLALYMRESFAEKHFKTEGPEDSSSSQSIKGNFFTRITEENGRARLQIRDRNRFQISTIYQKRDRQSGHGSAIALSVGRDELPPYEERVIEIIFDTEKISEEDAASWYELNKDRFASPRRFRPMKDVIK